jgi:gamma-glutamylcyclotransferase (GGCT)/AIG2-like uncharacterized protein YtfP
MELLFVYGTLLSSIGHPMGQKLRLSSSYLGFGKAYGRLYDIGEYPGFVSGNENGPTVVGEIYDLTYCHHLWAELDEYEGIGELAFAEYTRDKVTVFTSGAKLTCWTYVYQGPVQHLSPILDGDYLAYFFSKNQR